MIPRIFILLTFILNSFLTFSQITALKPVNDVFNTNISKGSYYVNLKNMILAELPQDPYTRVIVTSTTQPEYVLSVDKKNGRYMLTFIGLKENIGHLWTGGEYDHINYPIYSKIKYEVELGYQLAQKLNQLFGAATSNTRYSSTTENFKDTINYTYINAFGPSYRSGTTSINNIDNNLEELINITHWLRECAMNEKLSEPESNIKPIDKLTRRFN